MDSPVSAKFEISQKVLYGYLDDLDISKKHFSPGQAGQWEYSMLLAYGHDYRDPSLLQKDSRDAIIALGRQGRFIPDNIRDEDITIDANMDYLKLTVHITAQWDGVTSLDDATKPPS